MGMSHSCALLYRLFVYKRCPVRTHIQQFQLLVLIFCYDHLLMNLQEAAKLV